MSHRDRLLALPAACLHALAADLVGTRRARPLIQRGTLTLREAAVAARDAAERAADLLPWAWRGVVLLAALAVLIGVAVVRKGR